MASLTRGTYYNYITRMVYDITDSPCKLSVEYLFHIHEYHLCSEG